MRVDQYALHIGRSRAAAYILLSEAADNGEYMLDEDLVRTPSNRVSRAWSDLIVSTTSFSRRGSSRKRHDLEVDSDEDQKPVAILPRAYEEDVLTVD